MSDTRPKKVHVRGTLDISNDDADDHAPDVKAPAGPAKAATPKAILLNTSNGPVNVPVSTEVFSWFQSQFKNSTPDQQKRKRTLFALMLAAYEHGQRNKG